MQNSKGNIDIKLLMRYLEGKASYEETNIVRRWFTNADFEHELNEKSLQVWDGISLDPKIEEQVFLKKTNPKTRFINYLTRIAAILFIPLVVASLFYLQNNSFRDAISYAEIHSPIGTRTNFYLPDGSRGWLNGGSSLKFPAHFGNKIREVKLTGEAYFKVFSNHKKPFIVSTENIDIKVIGTTFNVMAYSDEQTTEITLEKGQVEVFRKINNTIKSLGILNPDELCTYNYISDSSKIVSINSSEKLSWIDGKLTFKYESFEDVVRKINRWYNVNIVIRDELLESYIYYGTFKDETLEEVLKLLQLTAPIRYRDIGRERNQDGTYAKRKIEIYYRNLK
jgi:transmembrane sensor